MTQPTDYLAGHTTAEALSTDDLDRLLKSDLTKPQADECFQEMQRRLDQGAYADSAPRGFW